MASTLITACPSPDSEGVSWNASRNRAGVAVVRHEAAQACEELACVHVLETNVTRDRTACAEEARAFQDEVQRAEATGGLADDAAPTRRADQASVARVEHRHKFIHDVIGVSTDGGGVDVLASAKARKAIGQSQDGGRGYPGGNHLVV